MYTCTLDPQFNVYFGFNRHKNLNIYPAMDSVYCWLDLSIVTNILSLVHIVNTSLNTTVLLLLSKYVISAV